MLYGKKRIVCSKFLFFVIELILTIVLFWAFEVEIEFEFEFEYGARVVADDGNGRNVSHVSNHDIKTNILILNLFSEYVFMMLLLDFV